MNAPVRLQEDILTEPIETRLTVPGMRCAGCIATIERGLLTLNGVASARVNLSARRVTVSHDQRLNEDCLVDELGRLGFDAQPVSADQSDSSDIEAKALLRALAVAGFGMMNIMLLSVSVWSGAAGVTRDLFHWLSALIALPVIAYSGRPFFASAATALRRRRTNMDVPISVGVLLATALSFYETLGGGDHAYFDSAVMLLFFLLVGRALDAAMRDRTRAGISALLSRMGRTASVIQADKSTRRLEASELRPGMIMLVAAGEALAADGVIEDRPATIDNSMLTGEAAPQRIAIGELVHAGAVNLLDSIRVRITAAGTDTALAGIARLMDNAGQSRSRYVRIADRASRLYAPVVHSLAVLAFAGWMIAGAGWHHSLVIAIAVLIITCPCAMGLAVPTAQVVASGALIRRGLLVKDGSALERLSEVDAALIDKTGTLTLGEPLPALDALSERERSIALALAQTSRHPLSRGLTKRLTAQGAVPLPVIDVVERPGVGIEGQFEERRVALERAPANVGTMALVLRVGEVGRVISFTDTLRSDAEDAIAALRDLGMQPVMVSGDRKESVESLANELGIDARAEMTPPMKLAALEALKREGCRPLMVGDGLNDGPALAAAHASIAPGTASDVSQQAADAVFVGEDLMPVALAVQVARRTMRVVRQNFAFAIGYNLLAVPLAVMGLVTPLVAAIAMSLSSLMVVGNSLRLARAAKELNA